jgi:L-asparaginase
MTKPASILVIYTGGTIGMVKDYTTGSLIPLKFEEFYTHVPELNRIDAKLDYHSFEKAIDSSDMNPTHWAEIATVIYENYHSYDGFVVLHGSDTMAYTASALSFMLQGLQKPVILTGSQLPIGVIRTDGKENLITAIEIAASKTSDDKAIIQEVAIYFEYSLYRGNRSSKVSADNFEAFDSPNFPILAVAGVNIEYATSSFYKTKEAQLELTTKFDSNVAIIKLFPGINWEMYSSVFDKAKAVIIESFGAGNTPTDDRFMDFLENHISFGGIVVNTTQCLSGEVELGKYDSSNAIKKAGVISAGDMTTESVVCKLMYLLGTGKEKLEIEDLFQKNIVGELTNAKNH